MTGVLFVVLQVGFVVRLVSIFVSVSIVLIKTVLVLIFIFVAYVVFPSRINYYSLNLLCLTVYYCVFILRFLNAALYNCGIFEMSTNL